MEAEHTVKDAQIARKSRDGREGWFDHDGTSFHVFLDDRKDSCAAHIYSPLGNGHSVSGRCSNKPNAEFNGFLFCGTHYPPKAIARKAARETDRRARYAAEEARWRANADRARQKDAALAAIKQIAAGHNDPRALAQEVLAMIPDPPAAGPQEVEEQDKP